MELVIALIVSACVVYVYRVFQLKRQLEQRLEDDFMKIMAAAFESAVVRVAVEEHNNEIYFYEIGTCKFICKASNLHDLSSKFTELYPGKIASLDQGNEELIAKILTEEQQVVLETAHD